MLFIDTSDLEWLARVKAWGCCSGVTTNPLILQKELAPGETRAERLKLVAAAHPGPLSVQLTKTTYEEMVVEAREIAGANPRHVLKVPVSQIGLQLIHQVSPGVSGGATVRSIFCNATAIMTFEQAYLAARAGAHYVSIFWNRIKDAGGDPHFVVRRTREVFDRQRMGTQIISGSIRTPNDVSESLKAGAHIVTVPPLILEKMLWHPQTDAVVEQFRKAASELL